LTEVDARLPVLAPRDVVSLTAMLQQADRDGRAIATRGGGTKWTWGSVPSRIDAVLSTTGLDGPIDHCPGDLTATVAAGATLRTVNEALARAGQWLPLDPPAGPRATIGGIVATNDCGPRRQKHGTPRDLIIGVEMVRADGRIAKAGGKVVKNVAGYDLARMLCGSFGTLAVITSATFKLAPLAPASRTVVATAGDARAAADLALAVAAAPSAPSAIEIQSPPDRVLVRFETTERAADQQAAGVRDLCRSRGAEATVLSGPEEDGMWRQYEDALWREDAGAVLVKVGVLPTDAGGVLEHAAHLAVDRGLELAAGGRVALGVLYFRISDGPPKLYAKAEGGHYVRMIDELRRHAVARKGSAVVLSAPAEIKKQIDPWGEIGSGFTVMRAVKARFDPNGTLNPGRGPGGL
jgi:glycolate oxidase FAD binding subunit